MNASPIDENAKSLTQERFDDLLKWLNNDRDRAGQIYEEIRNSLIKGFCAHGCTVPDELADETINRVAIKLPEFAGDYVGAPVRYFRRVAHYVHLEHIKRRKHLVDLPDDMQVFDATEDVEQEFGSVLPGRKGNQDTVKEANGDTSQDGIAPVEAEGTPDQDDAEGVHH
jgi:DNA-directed RNA polymerase specialized sigma24 family protein